MDLKKKILSLVYNVQISIAKVLLRINIFLNIIFVINYKKEKIKNKDQDYDNTSYLLKIVNHAIKNAPYYKNRYSKINSIDNFENKTRFINKSTTRDYNNELISENIEKSVILMCFF